MALGKRLINTGSVAAEVCNTDSVDPFGDSSGVALYSLDYDGSDAGGLYDGSPTNVDFGVGGQINYGARFNGSSSKIDINSLATVLDAQNIVSTSFRFKSTNTSLSGLFSYRGSASSEVNMFVALNRTATGDIGLDSSTSSAFVTLGTYNGGYNDGNWHHVVSIINYTTGAFSVYIDNTLRITGTNASISRGTADKVQLGVNYNTQYLNGDIDQVRIFNKALSSDEVSTLYAETACVYTCTTDTVDYPTTNVAYYKLDNSAEDETGSYDGTESNIEYRFGRFGQAAVFNGSSSVITKSNFASLSQLGLSMWVKISDVTSNYALAARYGTNREFAIYNYQASNGFVAAIYYNGNNSNAVIITAGDYLTNDTWHHIVFTSDGSTAPKLYIDGVERGTAQFSDAARCAYYTSTEDLQIGAGVSRWLNGSIDQVRIFSSALDSTQVTQLYEEKPCADTSTFKTVLYSGAASEQYISNVGFNLDVNDGGEGGLLWIKGRTNSVTNHRLFDTVRGASAGSLASNLTNAEMTASGGVITSFDANGFTIPNQQGDVNGYPRDYVAWVWKAGGDAVSNTDGSITSQVSANTDAGFSIVKYTGNSTDNATVGHGLSVAPNLVIVKDLDSSNYWCVGGSTVGDGENLYLNVTTERQTRDRVKSVQTDTFTLGSHFEVNSTNDFIAYCFHSVSGYSKIGSYTGNNGSGINKITLDFAPSWVMVKKTSDSLYASWYIFDTIRGDSYLQADSNASETPSATYNPTFLTDGFQWENGDNSEGWNNNGGTYLYMAFK